MDLWVYKNSLQVHLRAHLTLHATQPLSAMQLYFPKDLKEARQRSLGFHGKYSIGLEEAEDHEGFRPNLNFCKSLIFNFYYQFLSNLLN